MKEGQRQIRQSYISLPTQSTEDVAPVPSHFASRLKHETAWMFFWIIFGLRNIKSIPSSWTPALTDVVMEMLTVNHITEHQGTLSIFQLNSAQLDIDNLIYLWLTLTKEPLTRKKKIFQNFEKIIPNFHV